jgi:hypothetical protein
VDKNTGRPLDVRVKEHKQNLKQGLLEKEPTQHTYEEGHHIQWDEAKSVETVYRKYNQSAHMAHWEYATSQPSLQLAPIWLPVIKEEIERIQERGI